VNLELHLVAVSGMVALGVLRSLLHSLGCREHAMW
jgi:hypothetical protein